MKKYIEGTNTSIHINDSYIVRFNKITIFEDNRNQSKIIYMHGPLEYSIEYFESDEKRDNQYLSGPNSVRIIKEIIESANKRKLDIIISGITRYDETPCHCKSSWNNNFVDDDNCGFIQTEEERKEEQS